MLRDLKLKGVYRSENDNLLEDFYLPALKQSIAFDRAVGFFSAAMLSYAGEGVSALVENGGSMRLIFGGELEAGDADAIRDGYAQKQMVNRLGQWAIGIIDNLGDALARNRLEALAWLIAAGHLEVKVALRARGMYHEKMGVFRDAAGDQVIYQGSANETVYALLPDFNFESVSVYPTWREEFRDHYIPFLDGFEQLWSNKSRNTLVVDFPEAARDRLIKISKRSKAPSANVEVDFYRRLLDRHTVPAEDGGAPSVPSIIGGEPFSLRQHQRDALHAWKAQDFQAVLAMATGSGKTITAVYGLVKIAASQRLFVVIGVPYQALADQWVDILGNFNIGAIQCYANKEQWDADLTRAISLFQSGARRFVVAVVVNRTLQSPQFQSRLAQIPGQTLAFVGDECHHYGALGLRQALPSGARIRLGLSATPEHYLDLEATQRITGYFGQIAYRYSLADALRDGVLSPYNYYPHFVNLNEEESNEYVDLSARIAQLAAGRAGADVESASDQALKFLLFRRARLLGNASQKIELLSRLLATVTPTPFHLFYCGDGAVEGDEDTEDTRQIDQVSKVLSDHGWRVSHFTSRETRADRQTTLERFRVGLIDALAAIRCLDEGIDVPDCRTAYILASSRNPKQFIQRRGRILRRAPGKHFAAIHDFVVRLPVGLVQNSKLERELLAAELGRVSEFGSLASNRGETFAVLNPVLHQYDLQHLFV